uniref:Alpha-1,3-glucosyltransferase n=1 Tax=Heterorhabditis bacteriophora TaxID=37862 RepID=A0A1I7X1F4_HETBA
MNRFIYILKKFFQNDVINNAKQRKEKSNTTVDWIQILFLLCLVLTVQLILAVGSYSGNFYVYNSEGKSPMYGDYEAQRHWMEITYNLPVEQWCVFPQNGLLFYILLYLLQRPFLDNFTYSSVFIVRKNSLNFLAYLYPYINILVCFFFFLRFSN